MFHAWCYSSDRSALQVGMLVADSSHSGTGSPGLIYGHVGIYVGGGIAVSYTHLDVYKRQVEAHAIAGQAQRGDGIQEACGQAAQAAVAELSLIHI